MPLAHFAPGAKVIQCGVFVEYRHVDRLEHCANKHNRWDEFAMQPREERREREVLRAEDFSDDDLRATAAAKVPDEYAHLDAELEDGKRDVRDA